MNKRKLLQKLLAGSKNIKFNEMVTLLKAFGFRLDRVRGSHHIFTHRRVVELIDIQNRKGNAKPYQVRQFLRTIEQYSLDLGDQP